MSEVKVNKLTPRTNCGTVTLGDSGDSFTIPSGVTITNNGTQTGFGRTGTVDWQTGSIKTATFTAANGEESFENTDGGAFTMNLPAGTAGNIVSVVDYTNTFQTNKLTITPNGSQKIGGTNDNAELTTEGQSVTFVYVDDTEGWKNVQDSTSNVVGQAFITASGGNCVSTTPCGSFKIHKFTAPGTFTVSGLSPTPANNEVSYILVGGGGGGGKNRGGGGGAGGFRERKSAVDTYTASPINGASPITVTAQGYSIVVGGGGAASTGESVRASNGVDSTAFGLTSAGGGGGGGYSGQNDGANGGSGGGAGSSGPSGNPGGTHSGGTGNSPPTSPAQGFNGGQNTRGSQNSGAAGGGGALNIGAEQDTPGTNRGAPIGGSEGGLGGDGGKGATTCITGSPVAYAGGGGGGGSDDFPSCTSADDGGTGGMMGSGATGTTSLAGGGNGGAETNPGIPNDGQNGTANTGGGAGGGAGAQGCGGVGGSGVVIIRYKVG